MFALCACGRIGFDGLATGNAGGDGGRPGDGAISFGDGLTTTMNIMFISDRHMNPADLLSIEGGDNECQDEAYGYAIPGTFVAWLSDRTRNAKDLIAGSRGWVRLDDGKVFAASPAALLAGQLENPPATIPGYPVVTATDAAGNWAGDDCSGWTGPSSVAMAGNATAMGATWTSDAPMDCGQNAQLYCFAIDP
jgi:hypothetical protein